MEDSNDAIDALLAAFDDSESTDLIETANNRASPLVSETEALGLLISDDEDGKNVVQLKDLAAGTGPPVMDTKATVLSELPPKSESLVAFPDCLPPSEPCSGSLESRHLLPAATPADDFLSTMSLREIQEEIIRLESRVMLLRKELIRREPLNQHKQTKQRLAIMKDCGIDLRKPAVQPPRLPNKPVSSSRNISRASQLSSQPSTSKLPQSCSTRQDGFLDFSMPTLDDRKDEHRRHASVVHTGDSDSSDDEQFRNPMQDDVRRLSDNGRAIKKQLNQVNMNSTCLAVRDDSALREKAKVIAKSVSAPNKTKFHGSKKPGVDSLTLYADYDSFFRIRVLAPIVPSTRFDSISGDRCKIRLSDLAVKRKAAEEQEWVTMGVVVEKLPPKTSATGSTFAIFRISDLIDCNASVKLFLFGNCYKQHWKISAGTVFALLNGSLMDSKGQAKSDESCLKFDNPEQFMEIGMSRDLGFCQSKRKDKKPCTNFINKLVGKFSAVRAKHG